MWGTANYNSLGQCKVSVTDSQPERKLRVYKHRERDSESLREWGLVSQKVAMFVETVVSTAPITANLAPFGAIVSCLYPQPCQLAINKTTHTIKIVQPVAAESH